jgi:hypothetical protein
MGHARLDIRYASWSGAHAFFCQRQKQNVNMIDSRNLLQRRPLTQPQWSQPPPKLNAKFTTLPPRACNEKLIISPPWACDAPSSKPMAPKTLMLYLSQPEHINTSVIVERLCGSKEISACMNVTNVGSVNRRPNAVRAPRARGKL